MRRSGRLFIVLGVVLALAALLLAIVALSGGGDDGETVRTDEPEDVTIVQARREVPGHTVLTEEDVEEVVVSADTVTEDNANSVNEVVGFGYADDLVEGQSILRSRLEVAGTAADLEAGRRAISLPVTQNQMVAGLLREDDSIDLMFQINAEMTSVFPTTPLELPGDEQLDVEEVILPPFGEEPSPAPYPFEGEPGSRFTVVDADAGNPVTKVVLQNIRVMRIITEGEGVTGEQAESGFLVLDVSPSEAELVATMANLGNYSVMLRGPDDEETVTTPGVNMERLVTEYDLPMPKTIRLPGAGAQ